ncbi:MAG TPA: riboflavin synthase [Steroidobacteraceae bacterium]|nr:riboflavin synthase [Steroidobacteraceae bacterium]
MFTGIITASGRIAAIADRGGDLELAIAAAGGGVERLRIGDSISVQGVCLTVTRQQPGLFFADVSRETLAKTTFGRLAVGSRVNLEPCLRAGDPLGGHLVSGHVDGLASVVEVRQDGRSTRLFLELPDGLARFVAPKGSVCIDGVSLTVNEARGRRFDVNIIPHTQQATTLGERRAGDDVNVEIDLIARYLQRLTASTQE